MCRSTAASAAAAAEASGVSMLLALSCASAPTWCRMRFAHEEASCRMQEEASCRIAEHAAASRPPDGA
eukprot:5970294-Prymnesium_polylepis.1